MYGFVGEYSSSDSDSDESVPLATTIETWQVLSMDLNEIY